MKYLNSYICFGVYLCFALCLKYWLCGHVDLVEPANEHGMPRYSKWRLKDMVDALNETALKDIQPSKVRARPVRATDEEHEYLDCRLSDDHMIDGHIGIERGGPIMTLTMTMIVLALVTKVWGILWMTQQLLEMIKLVTQMVTTPLVTLMVFLGPAKRTTCL